MSQGAWEFLANPTNRTVLGWIGGGVATIVAGGWAVFLFLAARTEKADRAAAPPAAASVDAEALVENIVEKFLADRRGAPEPPLMAPGLAVGYYFNFIDIVAQLLEAGTIRLRQGADPGEEIEFDLSATSIQIIMPARLSEEAFQRCFEDFAQTLKGSLFVEATNRIYAINYRIFETGGVRRLTIVDLARPAMALMHFYSQGPGSADSGWEDLQGLELAAFEKTLGTLQARRYHVLANKLDIVRRGRATAAPDAVS